MDTHGTIVDIIEEVIEMPTKRPMKSNKSTRVPPRTAGYQRKAVVEAAKKEAKTRLRENERMMAKYHVSPEVRSQMEQLSKEPPKYLRHLGPGEIPSHRKEND